MGQRPADIWPRPHLRLDAWIPDRCNTAQVERRLAQIYPGSNPVLFSSARAGLHALMRHLGLTRAELVWTPRFSSHCVIDAIARRATPSTWFLPERLSAVLLIHQWGFSHKLPSHLSIPIIEDSADSLFFPGSAMFGCGGRFELISLPKVLGCFGGGVVFCRDEADAGPLRRAQAESGTSPAWLQFILRRMSHVSRTALTYWLGAEAESQGIVAPVLRDILRALDRIESVIEDRRRKLEILSNFAPKWLPLNSDRLPSNFPLEFSAPLLEILLASGYPVDARHFNAGCSTHELDWIKVIRVPLHQDMPLAQIEQIALKAEKCRTS